jgi:uncharacterized protein (TIGR01777 family)
MKIVACGVSGLIGAPLCQALSSKYEVVRMPRQAGVEDWVANLEAAHAVINLSGEPIAGRRWTSSQKKELRDSRIFSTQKVVRAIGQSKTKPQVLLNASAIGFYGPRGQSKLDESAQKGEGFLAELCQEWEEEARKAESFGVRVVNLRTGIVLSKNGGALSKMLFPFRLFLGGPLGSGKQIMSWIHIDDEVAGIIKALEDPTIRGPVNLVAPNPVTMSEFAKTLGKVLRRPSFLPVPGAVLKILLGEMSGMLLTGQNVSPKKLTDTDFKFKFTSLEPALRDLLT